MAYFDVLRSASGPSSDSRGVGGDSETIWHSDTSSDDVYELSTADFSVVRSAASPSTYPGNIGGDTDTIWLTDTDEVKVYELSATDFSEVRQAASQTTHPRGIGGDANTIWHCESSATTRIYELSTTDLSSVRYAAGPFTFPRGIGGDANTIWHCDANKDKVYELSTTDFSEVRDATSPTTFPRDVGGDANTVWYCESINDKVYELNVVSLSTKALGYISSIRRHIRKQANNSKGGVFTIELGIGAVGAGITSFISLDRADQSPIPGPDVYAKKYPGLPQLFPWDPDFKTLPAHFPWDPDIPPPQETGLPAYFPFDPDFTSPSGEESSPTIREHHKYKWRYPTAFWGTREKRLARLENMSPGVPATRDEAVLKTLFDANTILKADADNVPEALPVAEQTLVGRITSGEIAALTAAQVKTLLAIIGTDVEVSELSTATYDDVQDYINFFGDRVIMTGGTITDAGSGTAAMASCTAWCKETDSDTAVGKFFDFDGDVSIALTDLVTNFIYLDYNGGTPQVVVATSIATYGFQQDHIFVAAVFRNGTTLHIHQTDPIGIQSANRTHMHWLEHFLVHRVSGMVTSETGTRNLDVDTGVLYAGLNRHATNAFNTSAAGRFSYWYYDGDAGPAVWVEVATQSQISRTQYNALATGLANLGSNRYGVHWVYMDNDGVHLHVVYGQGDYTASQAENASIPSSLPPLVTGYCVLIAKIICQEGQDTLIISYPWTSTFATSLATDHGSLAGLTDVADHAYALLHDGTRALTGAWDMGNQILTNVNIDSGVITGITDLAVADGGTGASNAADARTALGLVIGTDVLAYDTGLSNLAGVAMAANKMYYTSGDNVHVATDLTAFGRTWLAYASATAAIAGLSGEARATFDWHGENLTGVGTLNTHTIPGGTDTFVLLAAAQGLTNKTLTACVAAGIWTASGTWTIPAATLSGTVALGGQTFDAGAASLIVNTTGATQGLAIKSTFADIGGPALKFTHDSATPAANDYAGTFAFYAYSAARASIRKFGEVLVSCPGIVDGAENGKFVFRVINGGADNAAMRLYNTGWLDVDASGIGAAAQVDEFDDIDDVEILQEVRPNRDFSKLEELGVFVKKDEPDSGSSHFMRIQPMMYLMIGAIRQNETRISDLEDENKNLRERLERRLLNESN